MKIFRSNPMHLIINSATGHFLKKMMISIEFLIRQTNMKKFGLESDQKSKQLMVEKNCFMKKTTLGLELILTMICL